MAGRRRSGRAARAAAAALTLLAGTAGAAAQAAPPAETLIAGLDLPEGEGPFPAVLLMHGCAGLSPPVRRGLRRHAEALVAQGFAAVTVDSFGPRGKAGGAVCRASWELAAARIYRLDDAYAVLSHLSRRPEIDGDNVFVLGQSNGGGAALILAGDGRNRRADGAPRFAGVVAYYPWCGALPRRVASPVLILVGEADDWTPAALCLRALARNARAGEGGAPIRLETFEGAHHSFDLPVPVQRYAGHTVGGDPEAAAEARARHLHFLRAHLR